jgi:hypothetical protein
MPDSHPFEISANFLDIAAKGVDSHVRSFGEQRLIDKSFISLAGEYLLQAFTKLLGRKFLSGIFVHPPVLAVPF